MEIKRTLRSSFFLLVMLISSGAVFAQAPSVSASNIQFGTIGLNSLAITWTRGNGDNCIVVVKPAVNSTSLPSNGVNYASSSVYGSGANLGNNNWVVYDGVGTGITVTNLLSNTNYSVLVYEYNIDWSGIEWYKTTSVPLASHYTLTTAPTSPPSGLTISSITSTGASASWTAGNGANHLMAVRAATSYIGTPVDGNEYYANTCYGWGSLLGSSSPYAYVVKDGAGTSTSLSCLSPATDYSCGVFTYNGISGANNYYATGSYDFFTTLASEPTSGSNSFYITDVTSNAFTINWMKPVSGGGTNSLVIMKPGTTNTDAPVDMYSYTANSAYGSGSLVGSSYTVYNGTGNSVRVTGLTANSDYAIVVYEFNGGTGTFNNTHNYFVSSYLLGIGTTNSAEPTLSSSSLVLTPSTNSITANWSNGNGTTRVVIARPARLKTALAFDAANDYVSVPYNSALHPTGAFTVEAWHYRPSWTASVGGYSIVSTLEGAGGYTMYFQGTLFYGYSYRNNTYASPYTDISYLSPGWHHFAITFDGRYTRIYVDGAEKKYDDASAYYSQQYQYSNNLIIGAEAGTSTLPNGFYAQGSIDEVRVWSICNSANIIRTNMRKGMVGNDYGLEGYWKLDDGFANTTVVKNSSANTSGIDGVLTNSVSTAASSFTSSSGWHYSGAQVDCPVDFSGYSGSSNFMSGSIVGNYYYAVMNSTANSVTINNLTPGTYYNVCVYEYNNTGYTNYLHSSFLQGDVQTTGAPVPVITSFTPASGTVGTTVTISGSNFSTTTTNNIVYFGAARAVVNTATANQLTVTVPYCANYVPVTVEVNSAVGYALKPFVVTTGCSGSLTTGSFSGGTTPGNSTIYGLAAGDLDGDGKADLVHMNSSSPFSYMGVSRGTGVNGTLSFASPAYYTGQQGLYDVKLADIDGDGKLDVVTSSTASNVISVWRNTSVVNSIQFGARMDFATNSGPTSVAVADFDGDGKSDVLVGYNTGTSVSVFRSTSSIGFVNFADKIDFIGFSVPNNVAAADIDGDGKYDISAANFGASSFGCMRNTSTVGTLSFSAVVSVATSAALNGITWGDCDLDGKMDVITAQSNNTIRVFRNTNISGNIISGNFLSQTSLTTLVNSCNPVALSDLDGDGRPDLTVGYQTSNSVSVFEQTGSFTWAARVDLTGSGTNSNFLLSTDFSLDGKSDIFVGNSTASIQTFNNVLNPLASEPSNPATNMTFTGVSQTQVTVNFVAGTGADRIVVARATSSTSATPMDGVGYSPNTVFGSGANLGNSNYVVYNGNGNSVTVTGLQSNTSYTFSVYEVNGTTCSANYLLIPNLTGNITTLNTPPTISSVSNPSAICQNSGLQVVNLTGIGTGAGNETQTLSVTATSNNQTLIPNGNISVTYTSPNSTGSVSYTPVNAQSGTAIITVTVNDNAPNNNLTTTTFTVTVNGNPTASNAGPNQNICTGSTTLAGNTPTTGTGTWSFIYTSNGAITIANLNNPLSSISNFNVGDSVRLAWTISNAPCSPSVTQMSIKRGTCPLDANFSANQTSFCGSSANVTFTDLSTASSSTIVSWAWSFPGGSPSSFSGQNPPVIVYPSGVYSVTLTVTDNFNSTNTETRLNYITVTALPGTPGPISGNTTVCAGQSSVNYSVASITDAVTYNWTVPSGATIVSGQGTQNIVVDYGTSATTGNITVNGVNTCGNGNTGFQLITVNPLPANTGTITGPTSVCQGQTGVVFSILPVNNANPTGYNWTLPPGATITSGTGTNSITVTFSSSATSGMVDVVGTNSCGSGSSSSGYNISVNPLPDPAGVISGPSTVCQGDTVVYSISALNNADTYVWTVPTGATIIAGNNTTAITVVYGPSSVNGNVTVAGNNPCGNGTLASLAVTVAPLPGAATSILGSTTVCAGDAAEVYFVSSITNATGYVWTVPSGYTIISGQNTNGISVSFSPTAQSGVISVYGTNSCGVGASATINITIDPLPDSSGVISGSVTVCQGQTGVVYTVPTIANATSYNWTVPVGANIVSGNNTSSITVDYSNAAISGYVTVIGSNSCGLGLYPDSLAVTVDPLPGPAGTIVGDSSISICPMQTGVVYSIPVVPNATGYTWVVPTGANIVSGNNTNAITVDYTIGAMTGNISVTPTNGCGSGTSYATVIEVDTVPGLNICLVTVDSTSTYNDIVWDKPVSTAIDSFIIYREITTNNFQKIGGQPYSAFSSYRDSVFQSPLANPNNTNYRYKITAQDACGNESYLSAHHRTIFLQASIGVGVINLSWIPYEGSPVIQYYIYRDTLGTGALQLIDSVPGVNTVYTDNNPPVSITTVRYVLGVEWGITCNPSLRFDPNNPSTLAAINNTKSNIKSMFFNPNAVNELALLNSFNIMPNPSLGIVNLVINDNLADAKVTILNSLGQKVTQDVILAGQKTKTYDLRGFAAGVYTVSIEMKGTRVYKKLIIQ